jgi:competence protein ComEC
VWIVSAAVAAVASQLAQGLLDTRAGLVVAVALGVAVAVWLTGASGKRATLVACLCVLSALLATRPVEPPEDPQHLYALLDERGVTTAELTLEARVVSSMPRAGGGMRYLLTAKRLAAPTERPLRGRMLLYVRSKAPHLAGGEVVRFRSRLRRISGFGNPGELDWVGWNARRGVYVSGFVWSGADLQRSPGDSGVSLARYVGALRLRVATVLTEKRGRGGALMAALVTGERGRLSAEDTRAMTAAGLAHVLAISGLHLGLVGGGVYWLAMRTLLRTRWPRAGVDVSRLAVLASMLATLGYAALSGGGVSVTRATWMAVAAAAATWRGRPGSAVATLAAAALAISLAMPGIACEAGFQLSFAAVSAILAHAAWSRSRARKSRIAIFDALAISLTCWLVTAPIVTQHFARFAVYGAPATVATAPLATIVVASGLFCAAGLAAGLPEAFVRPAANAGALAAEWLLRIAGFVSALPGAELELVAPGPWLAAVLVALPIVFLSIRGRWQRPLVASLLVLATGSAASSWWQRYRSDVLDVYFLSVGQGDAAVIKLPGGKIAVVDAGPPGRGATVVGPFLRRIQVRRIDHWIVTHAQEDHYGGAEEILDRFEVGEVWSAAGACAVEGFERLRDRLSSRGARLVSIGEASAASRSALSYNAAALPTRSGVGWRMIALWPRDDSGLCNDNDRSVVLRIDFSGRAVLLTGDIEARAEARLAALDPAALDADVANAPHHGSRTSSTAAFVAAVSPEFVVASAGSGNRYGFPRPEVVARYRAAGSRFFCTADDGAVHARIRADGSIALRTTLH